MNSNTVHLYMNIRCDLYAYIYPHFFLLVTPPVVVIGSGQVGRCCSPYNNYYTRPRYTLPFLYTRCHCLTADDEQKYPDDHLLQYVSVLAVDSTSYTMYHYYTHFCILSQFSFCALKKIFQLSPEL